jgi:hypothetical protein
MHFNLFTALLLPAVLYCIVNAAPNKTRGHARKKYAYSVADYKAMKQLSETNCFIKRSSKLTNCSMIDRKCLLYYFHMHKTGGTSLCQTANNNQFKTTGIEYNCNIPHGIFAKNQYMAEHNITFIAQEGGMFMPIRRKATNPLYFVTIREPLDRILSHVHHGLCLHGSSELIEMRKMGCPFDPLKDTFTDVILDKCLENMYYVKNFYVQQFGDCRHDTCTEEHLQKAINVLHLMSAIVITEEFNR